MALQPNEPDDLKLEPFDAELRIFPCSYPNCNYKNKWEDDVACHERSHNPSLKWDIHCGICRQQSSSLDSFLHHMSSQHGDKLFCPLCGFEAAGDWTELKPHILSHIFPSNSVPIINKDPTEFRCGICSKYSTTKAGFINHVKNNGCKSNPFPSSAKEVNVGNSQESFAVCQEPPCPPDEAMDNPAKEAEGLKLESLKEVPSFSCSYPNCIYKGSRHHVARHEKSHDSYFKWDLFCIICPDSFGSVVSFLHHMYTQHRDKLLCPLCRFQAGDWTKFKPHILSHSLTSKSVPIVSNNVGNNVTTVLRCAICSVIFTSKESLSGHVKKCCRKLKPGRSAAKKLKADGLDTSQESFERSKQTEESGRYKSEEASIETSTGESILGL